MGTRSRIGKRPAKVSRELRAPRTVIPKRLWQLDFAEVTGHNLESRGRKEVNRLLEAGWRLLLAYTLRYEEKGVWRERPMAILGRLRNDLHKTPRGDEQSRRKHF